MKLSEQIENNKYSIFSELEIWVRKLREVDTRVVLNDYKDVVEVRMWERQKICQRLDEILEELEKCQQLLSENQRGKLVQMIPKPTKKPKYKMTSDQIQKYKKYTVSKLVGMADRRFKKFIRERDRLSTAHFRCISCGEVKQIRGDIYHAGHYYPAGKYLLLRHDEDNCHGQCKRCNYFLSGNLTPYRASLIAKIGIERVERLDEIEAINKRMHPKWDRFSLIEKIEKY